MYIYTLIEYALPNKMVQSVVTSYIKYYSKTIILLYIHKLLRIIFY